MLPIRNLAQGRSLRCQTARGLDVLRFDGEGLNEFLNYLTLEHLVDLGVTEGREEGRQFYFEFFPIRAWEDPDSPIVAFSVEDHGLLEFLSLEGGCELFIHPSRDLVQAILDYRERLVALRRKLLMENSPMIVDEAELSRRLRAAQIKGAEVFMIVGPSVVDKPRRPGAEECGEEDASMEPLQLAIVQRDRMTLYCEDTETDGYRFVERPPLPRYLLSHSERELLLGDQVAEVYWK